MREVTVGDRTVPIPDLNGFKTIRVLSIVTAILKVVPNVNETLAQLRRDYAEQNVLIVTPAMMKLDRFQEVEIDADGQPFERPMFTAAEFEAAGGEIALPAEDPPGEAQLIAVFPLVFDAAQDRIVELLALLLAPNSELAEADENGTVDSYLATHGRTLLHTATLEQLIAIVVAAVGIVQGALANTGGDALEQLRGAVTGSDSPTPNPTPPLTADSLTDSPDPTVGADEQSSTKPLGPNSKSYSSA